jgi:hypothetical protein
VPLVDQCFQRTKKNSIITFISKTNYLVVMKSAADTFQAALSTCVITIKDKSVQPTHKDKAPFS